MRSIILFSATDTDKRNSRAGSGSDSLSPAPCFVSLLSVSSRLGGLNASAGGRRGGPEGQLRYRRRRLRHRSWETESAPPPAPASLLFPRTRVASSCMQGVGLMGPGCSFRSCVREPNVIFLSASPNKIGRIYVCNKDLSVKKTTTEIYKGLKMAQQN
jgi:hypothetical protein